MIKRLRCLVLLMICFVCVTTAQTNTSPLPAGETKIGGHLRVGAANEVWTDASSLFFNYRGNADATFFWNLSGSQGKSILSLNKNGRVGIGINYPKALFEIAKSGYSIEEGIRLTDLNGGASEGLWIQFAQSNMEDMARIGSVSRNSTSGELYLATKSDGDIKSQERIRINHVGYVGIGIQNPEYKLDVNGNVNIRTYSTTGDLKLRLQGKAALTSFNASSNGTLYVNRDWNSTQYAHSDFEEVAIYGNVGIGTDSPTEELDVIGTIKATEIKVEAQTADFVFEEDYQLKELSEVEQFITTNKHLPDIPSARQMEENGVGLAEMNKLLLQKVEELTLYVIELQKTNENQQKQIDKLIEEDEKNN